MRIALVGEKGGSGKSTAAISLGVEWMLRGKKVLLVDADPQQTLLTWRSEAARHKEETPVVVAMGEGLHRPDQLPKLSEPFDHTIIDCPGKVDAVQRGAMFISDLVLMPCSGSGPEVWSLARSIELFEQANTMRGGDLEAYILLNRIQKFTSVGKEARGAAETGGKPVLETVLGYRVAYQEALSAGCAPSNFDGTSVATKEVVALVDELEEIERQRLQQMKDVVNING